MAKYCSNCGGVEYGGVCENVRRGTCYVSQKPDPNVCWRCEEPKTDHADWCRAPATKTTEVGCGLALLFVALAAYKEARE